MRAENYYQTSRENAIPLNLLTRQDWLNEDVLNAFDRNCLTTQGFEGRLGNIGIIPDNEGKPLRVYIGANEGETDAIVIANIANLLPSGCYVADQSLSQAALVAWSLSQYRFEKYKSNASLPRVLVVKEQVLSEVVSESAAIFLVRDLINIPTNEMGPEHLAAIVAEIAEKQGATFKQWVGEELLEENFPAIYTVGRPSESAPRLLSLEWGNEAHPRVALVGKGVCFDSGGLNIKPAVGMRLMKKDMGGAAHVIGLAQWLMTQQVPIRLHVLIPAVENLVDAQSYRPGDVLTMRNGLKVEIHDTDAEGRLVLADALVKACEEKPELIIDFATLTGAARVAVGPDIAALFTNNDKLASDLAESARETNDPIWRLPIFDGYMDYFKSSIADFSNASPIPYAGAITAALFLQHFISSGVPWAHFDIMAWNIFNKPGRPEGGEAMGIKAVGHYLRAKYKRS